MYSSIDGGTHLEISPNGQIMLSFVLKYSLNWTALVLAYCCFIWLTKILMVWSNAEQNRVHILLPTWKSIDNIPMRYWRLRETGDCKLLLKLNKEASDFIYLFVRATRKATISRLVLSFFGIESKTDSSVYSYSIWLVSKLFEVRTSTSMR